MNSILSTTKLIEICVEGLIVEYFNSIKPKYSGKEWFRLLAISFRKWLDSGEDLLGNDKLSLPQSDSEKMMTYEDSKKKVNKLLFEHKLELNAEEYFFLKGIFAEDIPSMQFLFKTALAMHPESIHLYVISNINEDLMNNDDALLSFQKTSPLQPKSGIAAAFFSLIRLNNKSDFNAKDVEPEFYFNLFKNAPNIPLFRFALLIHVSELLEPKDFLPIVVQFGKLFPKDHFIDLIFGDLYFKLEEYTKAIDYLEEFKIDETVLPDWLMIEHKFLLFQAYRMANLEGKAILLLKEIVGYEFFENMGHDHYYEAVIELANYYIKIKDFENAERTINVNEGNIEYLKEYKGAELFAIQGDIKFAKNEIRSAVRLYKMSYTLKPQDRLKQIIQSLTNGRF